MITVHHESLVATLEISFPETWQQKSDFYQLVKNNFWGVCQNYYNFTEGGYGKMITVLDKGGGSLETPKSDYVICAQPLSEVIGPLKNLKVFFFDDSEGVAKVLILLKLLIHLKQVTSKLPLELYCFKHFPPFCNKGCWLWLYYSWLIVLMIPYKNNK